MSDVLRILLVEDPLDSARAAFEEEARVGGLLGLEVTHASRGDAVMRLDDANAYDLVLVDLDMPDRDLVATVEGLAAAARSTPLVVRTPAPDDALSDRIIAGGADDLVGKGDGDAWQLARTLRHAVARSRRMPQPVRLARDQRFADLPPSWFGEHGLSSTLPHVFQDFVGAVGDLVDLTVRCPTDSERQALLAQVQVLAARLSMLTASPRDVLEVHQEAVARRNAVAAWGNVETRTIASRWIVEALLSELCMAYRREILCDLTSHAS
jgi:DNA-binding NarL/FixJ family response regulator